MADPKRRALGRGLDALLPASRPLPPPPPPVPVSAGQNGSVASATPAVATPLASPPAVPARSSVGFLAPIEELHANRTQPRTHFDESALEELSASLKEIGMLEPILVRRRTQGGYEIVAGERRWRAAQRAGLHEVPVYLRELSEAKVFEAALVENLQREDLNPLETARAYHRLIDEHGHTAESVAKLIGKDRSTVSNSLRLLKLPESLLERIEHRQLSEGHGRALLGAASTAAMERLAREAIDKGWSVRETERRARLDAAAKAKPESSKPEKSANVRDLEERLSRQLATRVGVADRKGKGHLSIAFSSYDELDRLLEVLMK